MNPRFEVHCDAIGSTFALGRQQEEWRQYFTDLRDALDYATEIATEETPVTIYNELGCVIVESVIAPKRAPQPSRQNVSVQTGTDRMMTNAPKQLQADGRTTQSPLPQQAAKPSYDEIAWKAYLIALDRHARGEPADPLRDWVEAEHLLLP
jgi:hypothetical protein